MRRPPPRTWSALLRQPTLGATPEEAAKSMDDAINPQNYNLQRLFPAHLLNNNNSSGIQNKSSLKDLVWEGQSSVISAMVGISSKLFMSLNRVQVNNKPFHIIFIC